MSLFKIEATKINKIWAHPNADKLSLASIEDKLWQFIVQKDVYKVGDNVVYFPIDSSIPEELAIYLGIEKMLSGGNRIRTVRLRGEYSQGFVTKLETIVDYLSKKDKQYNPETLTEDLGIIKWEPNVFSNKALSRPAFLLKLPEIVKVYDIEGCNNYPRVLEKLMDKEVHITEKLEGSHFALNLDEKNNLTVCQRKFAIDHSNEEAKDHKFLKTVEVCRYDILINKIKELLATTTLDRNGYFYLTLRGEILGPGIQNNYYELMHNQVRFFELEINGSPVDSSIFFDIFKEVAASETTVPLLAVGKLSDLLSGKDIQSFSNGTSALVNKLREGIVIKPSEEFYIERFGRAFLKMHSPAYLDKTGN